MLNSYRYRIVSMRAAALAALAALALSGCRFVHSASAQSSGAPVSVTVSWTAPTQNTNGSPITGALAYTVYEMEPCGSDVTCAADTQQLSVIATGVLSSPYVISNVPDGQHCYSVQTTEVLPDGANVASTIATLNTGMCKIVVGSAAPQPSPEPPTDVRVQVGAQQ